MTTSFQTLGLHAELVQAVTELGYEQPTPIQNGAIPAMLNGRDVLGQAQTGTGKTAAFTLPMLQGLDPASLRVQAIVLAPTRELALQVSNAIYRYGRHCQVQVLPIYGGQPYTRQTRRLERGVHVVVGTPGRTLDLIRQGALDLSAVRYLVLDEADEMLKMGFIEDVEAILSTIPSTRQTALFSATLPAPIRRLADRYMRDPLSVTIDDATMTVPQTEQRYYLLDEASKVAAVARLIEGEDIKSALIFTRTKVGAAELSETLLARGYLAEALHGDLSQLARESVLRRFRQGQITILVATDVVARGLDIQDVSHVINFDIPYDAEDYVHRIGRTGRAGRSGVAITLITPRDRRRLKVIEAYTRQRITRATLPSPAEIQARRDQHFREGLDALIAQNGLDSELALVAELTAGGYDLAAIAAAAIRLARVRETQRPIDEVREVQERAARTGASRDRQPRHVPAHEIERPRRARQHEQEPGMVRLSLDLGRAHGIRPNDVVGAIASEAGIPGRGIGAIDIRQNRTFVDVKQKHVDRVLRQMSRSTLRGQAVTLMRVDP